ncbi:hypothetical protein TspCOW1_27040 [Thiohalobacter sp. COW1]|uniref:HEPN domain-containing protein n=1 Tax=Thiohalobacter sp. COW1 TaxID=2795687 RepID=UPI0019164794|nr:HEPN domain-containing protein [Thiohalobacter sp. COW1]BCO32601.1 hypothetical protein TspCOW1_27040 [Thiohalobacter sp. COW1]
MSLSRKKVRELVGLTFSDSGENPSNWFEIAVEFHAAAKLLSNPELGSFRLTYFFNAGLAIELALKATILAKGLSFETNHKLIDLGDQAQVGLTEDQLCTLELLSEIIIWGGRYPVPKNERQWDHYHDSILEKHVVRERIGNTGRTRAYPKRFPSLENYLAIWEACEEEFRRASG